MSKKIKTRFSPLVLFAVLILIPQGATANLVICIENDGHINIELAHQGVCYPNLPSDGEISFTQNYAAHCVDVSISVSDLEQNILSKQGLKKLIKELQYAFISTSQTIIDPNTGEDCFLFLLPLNNSIISSLSSAILLI